MGQIVEGKGESPRSSQPPEETAKAPQPENRATCRNFIVQGTGTFTPPPEK